jgi:hypothetical protein
LNPQTGALRSGFGRDFITWQDRVLDRFVEIFEQHQNAPAHSPTKRNPNLT